MVARSQIYPTLDGMRGIAALAVLVYHFRGLVPLPAFKAGYLAVDLFFCLSGFVIAHAYDEKLRRGMTLARFAAIRLIRLWPMAALGAALGLVELIAVPASGRVLPVAALGNLLLLPAITGGSIILYPLNAPLWSLFYELAINLIYAAGLRRLPNGLLLLVIVGAFAVVALGIAHFENANIGWARAQLWFGFGRVTCGFLSGVLLYRLRDRSSYGRAARLWWLPLLLTAVALTLPVTHALRPFFDGLFILIGAPMLVWLGAASQPPNAALGWLAVLGTLSYPLYAIHFPFYLAAKDAAAALPDMNLPFALAFMAAACLVGAMSHRFYDEPVRRTLMRLTGARP